MNNEQFNEIIRDMREIELDEPYCKGTVFTNSVIRLLRKYIKE